MYSFFYLFFYYFNADNVCVFIGCRFYARSYQKKKKEKKMEKPGISAKS